MTAKVGKKKRPRRWSMQHGSPETAASNLRWQLGRATASRAKQMKNTVTLATLKLPEP